MLPDDWSNSNGGATCVRGTYGCAISSVFFQRQGKHQITRGRGVHMSLAGERPVERPQVLYRRRLCGFGGGAVDTASDGFSTDLTTCY